MSIYIIAEAGVNHNGDINKAIELAQLAKDCMADAVKYQTFKAELNVSKHSELAEYQVNAGINKPGQLEMQQEQEFTIEEWKRLKEYCDQIKIDFISTPDDTWSIQLLLDFDMKYVKVASAELDNIPFLEEIAATNRPVILSTGMGTLDEVKEAADALSANGCPNITLMHCTSNYPTKPEDANLNAIKTLMNEFDLPIGYSDHTLGNEAAVIAVAFGVTMIETHVTLDKSLSGPDHQASANQKEFCDYVKAIRKAELMLGSGIKTPQDSEKKMITSMRRSIIAKHDLKSGQVLDRTDLIFKRPGNGISPKLINNIVGKTINRDIGEDDLLNWNFIS
jgi:N,N'-diacetyllegionaminate synthase